ncbi:hypothetical protein DFJ43DRAFT_1152521 [Lentinula guzmanii]|uniref:F-box domain-containing protein n=1 Tax=Lentinula guzmanii TaxID=2804957 RepID=A0AA38N1T8_9AGAR|nr:hypothetical protein DFJ43DRAFT_1152521 [Lentinula guzmanii]
MTSLLLSLPDDILITILVALNAQDLISISLTCRALYVFCASTDYIWHTIDIDFPLNLSHQAIADISPAQLQKHCVDGLRVEYNWRKNPPSLKTLSRIEHGGIVDQIQYLAPQWLVSMARVSTSLGPTCVLSIWDCNISGDVKRIERISLEPRGLSKFSATLSEDRTHVLIVIFGSPRAEILRVYHIPLQTDYNADPNKYITSRLMANDVAESVFEADICGEIVSCLIARFDMGQPVYQLLFLDAKSGRHLRINVDVPPPFTKLQVRLFPDSFLLLSGVEGPQNLVLRIYDTTSILKGLKHSNSDFSASRQSLGTPCAKYSSSALGSRSQEYKLSASHLSTVAALIFPSGTSNRFVRFPVHSDNEGVTRFGHQSELQSHTFHKPRNVETYPEFISLGHRGQRAVWLERKWDEESDRIRFNLMKGSFPSDHSGDVDVGPLLREHIALPFVVDTCQSMAFDEATGRIFLGLYTGEIYVLGL